MTDVQEGKRKRGRQSPAAAPQPEEEVTPLTEAEQAEIAQLNEGARNPDWLLRLLVLLANRYDFEVGVTLTLGGSLITGTLIGHVKYLAGVEAVLHEAGADSVSEILAARRVELQDELAPNNTPVKDLHPGYIHLRDAQIFGGGTQPIPSEGGVLWRGRLVMVDGFSFGVLSHGSDNQSA